MGDACEYVFGPTGQPSGSPWPDRRTGPPAGERAATGRSMPMAPVFGTSMVRFFDLTAAMTGLTAKLAAAWAFPRQRHRRGQPARGLFSGAAMLTLKLTFDRRPGASSAPGGRCGRRRQTHRRARHGPGFRRQPVRDLAGLDSAYAAPFGSTRPDSPGGVRGLQPLDGIEEFLDADADLSGQQLVDVRARRRR